MARLAKWLKLALVTGMAALVVAPASQAMAGSGVPTLERGKGEKCVEDTQTMRRYHMDMLKHHRDKTMREGIRTTKHSLKGCVECHASEKTGSVASTDGDFCMACHKYTAVKLDCWDCHATKPMKKTGSTPAHAMSAPQPGMALPSASSGEMTR